MKRVLKLEFYNVMNSDNNSNNGTCDSVPAILFKTSHCYILYKNQN